MSNKKIGIINVNSFGNLESIQNAINTAGGKVILINEINDFKKVDKIVLPGVGAYGDAMKNLKKKNYHVEICNTKKPILGICLGMQILSTIGYEFGKNDGLNLVDGEVVKMVVKGPVPHMGFNKIIPIRENQILKDLEQEEFYFMHSYELVNYTDVTTLTDYLDHKFVSSFVKNNIFGVQFHPEKSRDAGIKLLENFIKL